MDENTSEGSGGMKYTADSLTLDQMKAAVDADYDALPVMRTQEDGWRRFTTLLTELQDDLTAERAHLADNFDSPGGRFYLDQIDAIIGIAKEVETVADDNARSTQDVIDEVERLHPIITELHEEKQHLDTVPISELSSFAGEEPGQDGYTTVAGDILADAREEFDNGNLRFATSNATMPEPPGFDGPRWYGPDPVTPIRDYPATHLVGGRSGPLVTPGVARDGAGTEHLVMPGQSHGPELQNPGGLPSAPGTPPGTPIGTVPATPQPGGVTPIVPPGGPGWIPGGGSTVPSGPPTGGPRPTTPVTRPGGGSSARPTPGLGGGRGVPERTLPGGGRGASTSNPLRSTSTALGRGGNPGRGLPGRAGSPGETMPGSGRGTVPNRGGSTPGGTGRSGTPSRTGGPGESPRGGRGTVGGRGATESFGGRGTGRSGTGIGVRGGEPTSGRGTAGRNPSGAGPARNAGFESEFPGNRPGRTVPDVLRGARSGESGGGPGTRSTGSGGKVIGARPGTGRGTGRDRQQPSYRRGSLTEPAARSERAAAKPNWSRAKPVRGSTEPPSGAVRGRRQYFAPRSGSEAEKSARARRRAMRADLFAGRPVRDPNEDNAFLSGIADRTTPAVIRATVVPRVVRDAGPRFGPGGWSTD